MHGSALRAEDASVQAVDLDLPDGVPRHDEFFGDTEVYLPPGMALEVPATAAGPLTLHWQGCAEAGICYPPQTLSVALPESADAAAAGARPDGPPTSARAAAPPTASPDDV